MPRTQTQLEQVRDQRRNELIEAARRVFARQGYANARMADISAEAGASYGLLYHYFPTKEAIHLALVHQAVEGSIAVTARAARQPGSPTDQLRWLTNEILEGIAQEPELPLLMAQAASGVQIPEAARNEAARAEQAAFANVLAIVVGGKAAGEIEVDDPAELAWAYLGLVLGLGVNALVWPAARKSVSADTVMRIFGK